MSTKTEDKRLGEWLAWMVDRDYCVETVNYNNAGAAATIKTGQVVETSGANRIPIATAANANGIIVNEFDVGAATIKKAACLVRGPALVVQENLIVGAVNLANIMTALNALLIRAKPIVDSTDKQALPA